MDRGVDLSRCCTGIERRAHRGAVRNAADHAGAHPVDGAAWMEDARPKLAGGDRYIGGRVGIGGVRGVGRTHGAGVRGGRAGVSVR